MNNLKDTMRPYKNYPFNKMLRLKFFFTICKYDKIVNNLHQLYQITTKILTKNGTNKLIGTLYGDILLGGTTIQELEECVKLQKKEGITSIGGYIREAIEASEENKEIGEVIDVHLKSIEALSRHDPENFLAIKISCFCNKDRFKELNKLQKDLITIEEYFHNSSSDVSALKSQLKGINAQKNIENKLNIIKNQVFKNGRTRFTINLYEIINNKETEKLEIIKSLFEDDLNESLINYVHTIDARLNKVIAFASQKKVSILMDAEESYFQNIIDNMIMHYMKIYNKDYSLLLHTIQQYLKQGPRALKEYIEFIRENNLKFGLKMVKGAYLKIETKMALENGYTNPVNDTIEQTQDNYHNSIEVLFQTVKPDEKVCTSFKIIFNKIGNIC